MEREKKVETGIWWSNDLNFSNVYAFVWVRYTIAVMKRHDERQLWEKRVYFTYDYTLLFNIKKSQNKNSIREEIWRQGLI